MEPPRRQGRQEKKREKQNKKKQGTPKLSDRVLFFFSLFFSFLSWRSWRLGGSLDSDNPHREFAMKRLSFLLLLLALAAGADGANDDAAAEDLKRMQGDWVVASMESDGMKIPDDDAMALFRSVKGDQYTVSRYRRVAGKGTIKLDATKKPRAIDALPAGAKGDAKALLGIYEFEGDKLKLCFARPGVARPTEFSAKEDSGHTLTVWQREKK
jgi:uncharacterized protein (TIGR03067 family)